MASSRSSRSRGCGPTLGNLDGLWGTSARDVFAVADCDGTILHHDGTRWSAMASGTTQHLTGVWGSSSRDVIAVGVGGTILRYDASRWTPPGGAVYAVGGKGTLLQRSRR